MAEAALKMFSASADASLWALLGRFSWMLLFYCGVPIIPKWNGFALMSPEAAARAATLRVLSELQLAAPPTRQRN